MLPFALGLVVGALLVVAAGVAFCVAGYRWATRHRRELEAIHEQVTSEPLPAPGQRRVQDRTVN